MAKIKKNGGHTGLPISIQRGNPIPLDKTSIYYDFEQMSSYAQSDPTAYVGQIVVLVNESDKKATAYIIKDIEGNLQEIGATASTEGYETLTQSIKELQEQIGSEEDSSGIYALLEEKADKDSVYTKVQVDEKISELDHLKRKLVSSVEEIEEYIGQADAEQYIFMVQSQEQTANNEYDEYMIIDGKVELIGSWKVKLDNYATMDDLGTKVDKREGYDLVPEADIEKLKSIGEGAEKNYITSVTVDFTVQDGQLNLVPLTIEKIEDLQDALDEKVTRKYTSKQDSSGQITKEEWTLLSPDDKAKLDAIIIGDSGDIEVSGKVSAENVEGLAQWIINNRDSVEGLYSTQDQRKLQGIQEGAEKNYIKAVESDFNVTEDGTLQLVSVDGSKVQNLEGSNGFASLDAEIRELQNNIQNCVTLENFESYQQTVIKQITDLTSTFDNYVTEVQYETDLDVLRQMLKWKDF